MAENVPNLRMEINIQIQEAQRVPNTMNTKRNILRQSINKIAKFKDQERILKTAREKQHIKGKKSLISLSADFSAGWKNWHDILNRSKEETDNHNSLLSRSSFGIE